MGDIFFQNAVGLELWSMTDEIVFDNFLVTDDKGVAEKWTEQTFQIKSAAEKASSGGVSSSHTWGRSDMCVRLIIKNTVALKYVHVL